MRNYKKLKTLWIVWIVLFAISSGFLTLHKEDNTREIYTGALFQYDDGIQNAYSVDYTDAEQEWHEYSDEHPVGYALVDFFYGWAIEGMTGDNWTGEYYDWIVEPVVTQYSRWGLNFEYFQLRGRLTRIMIMSTLLAVALLAEIIYAYFYYNKVKYPYMILLLVTLYAHYKIVGPANYYNIIFYVMSAMIAVLIPFTRKRFVFDD